MSRTTDILITALAPAVWGSTYLVTTEALPAGYPVTLAALRALPAGLLLLALTRCLPPRIWLGAVSPITQRSASSRLDLPQPLGPTTPVRPGAMTSSVGSTKLLKP